MMVMAPKVRMTKDSAWAASRYLDALSAAAMMVMAGAPLR
jgi:hypothetical protein